MKCANCKRTAEPGAAFCDSYCELIHKQVHGEQATEKLKDAALEADSLPYVWNEADALHETMRSTTEGRQSLESVHRSMKSGAGARHAVAAKVK